MNSLQAHVESPVIERAGWTLLKSSWQGLAIAVGLALVLPAATGGIPVPRLRRILGATDPHAGHPLRWLSRVARLSFCGGAIALLALTAQTGVTAVEKSGGCLGLGCRSRTDGDCRRRRRTFGTGFSRAARRAPQEDAVTKYREVMNVRGQQLTQEVDSVIAEARRRGADDPDAGLVDLKRVESTVTTAPDVEPQVREQLTRRLQNTMRELRTAKERITVEKVQNAERLAQVEARRQSLAQMSLSERRLTELIDQVRALLVQASHGDDNAYEQGETVAREAIHLNPGNGVATQALYNSEMGGQINKAYRLRHLRQDRLLETLYLVELAHVPFPDEPPIEWPNAQVWRALTERRKKWDQTDLRIESPTERRISEALDQTVDFTVDPEPLKDAIEFIAQRYQIPIMLDAKTLEDASIDTSTEVKMPVTGIKLRNMLKLLLEQLPQPLTYVIEDEVMKITTVEAANSKLTIRMYPVGDLVLGPDQLRAMSRGGGGRGGGQGGGMGVTGSSGGQGGGGMGGGGMF